MVCSLLLQLTKNISASKRDQEFKEETSDVWEQCRVPSKFLELKETDFEKKSTLKVWGVLWSEPPDSRGVHESVWWRRSQPWGRAQPRSQEWAGGGCTPT